MEGLFPLGQIGITSNASHALHFEDTSHSLILHSLGMWSDLDEEDQERNEETVKSGGQIFSSYKDRNDRHFWIITEAHRSVTTILLPEDY